MSKEKSARIANSPKASKKGGQASDLGSRTKSELLAEAKKIGITGRHAMKKEELIKAVRSHSFCQTTCYVNVGNPFKKTTKKGKIPLFIINRN